MYRVFYGDMAECVRVVLLSSNMKVTIEPTGKHMGLSCVAGGAVTMGIYGF